VFCSFRLFCRQLNHHDRGLYSVAGGMERKPSFLQDGSKLWLTVQDVTAADQASNLRWIFYLLEVNRSFRVLGDISCISVRIAHAAICTVASGQLPFKHIFQTVCYRTSFFKLSYWASYTADYLFTRTRHERTCTFKNASQLGLSFSVQQWRTLSSQLIL
jgi:hypothetical protein